MTTRRIVALAASFMTLAACYTGPQPVGYSPGLYLHQNQPKKIVVTLKDGTQQTVVGPRVIADTVFGWNETGSEDLVIAVSDMKEVAAPRLAVVRTALIPAAFIAGGILVFTVVKNASGSEPNVCGDGECDVTDPSGI
ncbi:MAG: hypothetical protein HY700_15485 [Gemmatimonadetes bacterium]|nr:hypothetical protein [Gemmatimonadota bacterium]